jgi:NAD(P)-dependent dehydrogenase (short-subunit alcohol dehydrogenase family)
VVESKLDRRSFLRVAGTSLSISPSPINTSAYDRLAQSGPAGQQMLASIVNSVPMGRVGTPDEIPRAAVFLASDDPTFVTGTELFVDGGAAQI